MTHSYGLFTSNPSSMSIARSGGVHGADPISEQTGRFGRSLGPDRQRIEWQGFPLDVIIPQKDYFPL